MNKIKYPSLKLKTSLLFLFYVLSFDLNAAGVDHSAKTGHFNVSLGNLCEYVGKIQTDGDGATNTCSFLPSLSTSFDYYLVPSLAISPQIGATLPKKGRDANIKRMTLFALVNGKYKTQYVNILVGGGFYITRIWGPGGDEELNNGNSTDSFPLPKDPVYATNFIMNLGVGMDFTPVWSAELYTYIFNALKSEDRSFSLGANLTYHFGDIL